MASALATRAEELLLAGDEARAREAAEDARRRAVATGSPAAEARALHVLGLLDDDPERLQRALQLLEAQPPAPPLWQQRAVLAELDLRRGRPEQALELAERSLAESARWPALLPRMRVEARLHHVRADALRRLQRADEAFAAERQAALALSVLDGAEALPLRRDVAQALGDAHAARGAWRDAFEQHALASSLSRGLGEASAEFTAVRALSRDLVGMGRVLDAADQARRGVDLARRRLQPALARELGLEALGWLAGSSGAEAATRRVELRAALDALARSEHG